MKLFPNRENNRVALRFAGCLVAGTTLAAVFGGLHPHFPIWQATAPAALMLLFAFFVIPEVTRKRR